MATMVEESLILMPIVLIVELLLTKDILVKTTLWRLMMVIYWGCLGYPMESMVIFLFFYFLFFPLFFFCFLI